MGSKERKQNTKICNSIKTVIDKMEDNFIRAEEEDKSRQTSCEPLGLGQAVFIRHLLDDVKKFI